MGRIKELVTGNDNKIRGAKLIVNTPNDSFNSICHRPVQNLIRLEIANHVENCNFEKIELGKEACVTDERPTRQAPREGQLLRRLREKSG